MNDIKLIQFMKETNAHLTGISSDLHNNKKYVYWRIKDKNATVKWNSYNNDLTFVEIFKY